MKRTRPWILTALILVSYLVALGDLPYVAAFTSPLDSPIPSPTTPPIPTATMPALGDWPQLTAATKPQPIPTATPTAPPPTSVWEEAELWMGVHVLLVNQHGEYCLPDLGACR